MGILEVSGVTIVANPATILANPNIRVGNQGNLGPWKDHCTMILNNNIITLIVLKKFLYKYNLLTVE